MSVVKLTINSEIVYNDEKYIIKGYASLDEVLAKKTTAPYNEKIIKVSELIKTPQNSSDKTSAGLVDTNDKDFQKALERYKIIESLVDLPIRTGKDVEKVAKKNKKGVATVYRWLSTFEKFGTVSSLVDSYKNSGAKGKSRLAESVDTVISSVLEELYLNKQKYQFLTIYRKIEQLCKNLELDIPNQNTVRNRIKDLDPKLITKYRRGEKIRDTRGVPGKFPEIKMPLDIIQIDHTKVDVILVDEETREEIGRPYITVAIDVFSRMIYGFYISYEAPSFFSVGQCLLQAILPKDEILKKYGVEGEWAVFGLPQAVHMDNGKDFQSISLKKFCQEYRISDIYRPVARPEFGGHVERVIKTAMKKMHELPGSTFSNIHDKGTYESQKNATMTISELEQWYTDFTVNIYHKTIHSSIGMTPEEKFYEGMFGVSGDSIPFLPQVPADTIKLKMALLPSFERTVQKNGITLDYITYFSETLRKWIIPAAYKKLSKASNKVVCRRDPRDVSKLYVYDPDINDYIIVPQANIKKPAMNLTELRRAISEAKKAVTGRELESYDIYDAYERLHQYVESSKKEKKSVRRQVSSKKHLNKNIEYEKQILLDDQGMTQDEKIKMKNVTNILPNNIDEEDDGYEYYPIG